MALLRVEHWSNLACVSGAVKLGVLPISAFVIKDTLDSIATRDVRCTFVATEYEHPEEVVPKTVLRAVYVDGSTAAGAFDEFIIDTVDNASGFGRGAVPIVALDPIFMLSREAALITGQFSGTVSAVLTALLAAGAPAEFATGTVTPTSGVAFELTNATALAGIQDLAKQSNAGADFAAGQSFAFQARRNGVTNYLIDCIEVGGSADVLDVRLSKNLHAMKQRQKRGDNPTRLYFTAQGQVIADAWFVIDTVVDGTDFTVEEMTYPALNPIFMDGAFTAQGLYIETEVGDRFALTGDIRATKTLSIADTTDLSAGMLFRFVANSDGDAVTYFDIPNTRPHFDFYDAPIPPGTNWLPNADFGEWQGTTPDVPEDWEDEWLVPVAGEWVEETTVTLLGASAAKAANDGDIYFLRPDGDGWSGAGKTFYCREGDTVTYVLWGRADTLLPASGASVVYFGNPNNGDAEGVNISGNEASWSVPDAWQSVSRSYVVETAGDKTLQFVIFKQVTTEYIFAGGMTSITPRGQAVPEGFFLGSSGARAWVMAVNRFLETIEAHSYEVQFRDLTRVDPTVNPYDVVTLGQMANVTAPDLLDEALAIRVVGAEFDMLEPLDTKLTLANKRDTLTDQLFGGLTFQTTNVQATTVGTPIDLSDPDDPPPPPPTFAPTNAPFVVWGPAPSLTASRIATPRGGTTLHNEAGTLGIRSPAIYTGATDPTTEDDEDVYEGDLWLEDAGAGVFYAWRYDGSAWVDHGGTVPIPVDPDDDDKVLTASGGTWSWEAATGGSEASTDYIEVSMDGVQLDENEDLTGEEEFQEPVPFTLVEDQSASSDFTLEADGTITVDVDCLVHVTFNATKPTAFDAVLNYCTIMVCVGNPPNFFDERTYVAELVPGEPTIELAEAIEYNPVLTAAGVLRCTAGDSISCSAYSDVDTGAGYYHHRWQFLFLRVVKLANL